MTTKPKSQIHHALKQHQVFFHVYLLIQETDMDGVEPSCCNKLFNNQPNALRELHIYRINNLKEAAC